MTPLVLKGTINWISIRKKLYEGLRQTRGQDFSLNYSQNFRYFVIDSPWPLLITDKQFNIVYANPAWEKLTKYTLSEVVGKSLLFLTHKRSSDFITKALFKGKSFKTESLINRRKDGKSFQTHSIFFSIKKSNHILYFVQISHDITLQKKHEQVSTQYKSVVNASNDAIFSLDPTLTILSVNPAAEKMYGYDRGELIGKSMTIIIPTHKQSEIKDLYKDIDGKVVNFETERVRKDGLTITVAVTNSPIYNQRHKLIGYSVIHRNISEKKKLDEQKKSFLSAASHELKTPITTLKLLLQVHKNRLKECADRSLVSKEIDAVDRELNHLTELINDLLDVSRFETGRFNLNMEQFSLSRLLRSTIVKIRLLYKTKIHLRLDEEITIIADKSRVEQVLTNLLINAIRHSKSEKQIEVALKTEQKDYLISVKDYGTGIPKSKVDHIFEQFYQAENDTQGFGLGLFICKTIVTLHKGKMWVKSKENQGSTFYFTLPIRKIR